MGILWTDVDQCNGYRLQRNNVTKEGRVLDPDNHTFAWGGMDRMEGVMKKMVEDNKGD